MLTRTPACLLYTEDEDLARRATAFLRSMAALRRVKDAAVFARQLAPSGPRVALVDLRAPGVRDALGTWLADAPHVVFVAFGESGSAPAREAEDRGVYAVVALEAERRPFQQVMRRALEKAGLLLEIDALRRQVHAAPPAPAAAPRMPPPEHPVRHFARTWRHMCDIEALLDALVEGVAGTAATARAGLFAKMRGDGPYRLCADRQCMDDTRALCYDDADPLVRGLEVHAHLVCRTLLDHLENPHDRVLFAHALDLVGAEVLVPLFARGRLLGWFFTGRRAAGRPFTYADLDELAALAEPVALAMDNALRYEDLALEKTLAETVLQGMPTGIVAVGKNGVIRWVNRAAEAMLAIEAGTALGAPAECAGSVLADLLRRVAGGEAPGHPAAWEDVRSGLSLSARAHPLTDRGRCTGALAMIENRSARRRQEDRRKEHERAAFWTELAAAMAHEIHNPLVAIQTFAQLLPERHDDPEFREEFCRLMMDEVQRLNGIIDQMAHFAHPPRPVHAPVDFGRLLKTAREMIAARHPAPAVDLRVGIRGALPPVCGDEQALAETLAHLAVNALEALGSRPKGRVEVRAEPIDTAGHGPGVRLVVTDNGPGIPDDLREKLFSPFSTTKPRGMGLGLPVARRTAVEHDGTIKVESGPDGTTITLDLPGVVEMARG